MKRYDLIVVGAGPAGLSAAVAAAGCGMEVAVFDENESPGGQLFKQIHKFFGSKEHRAKIRGFRIGRQLLDEAEQAGVQVYLNSIVMGLYDDREVLVARGVGTHHYKGDAVVVAAGAMENMIPFPGWTLPGVMGAGAAQTMMNLHGVRPGSRVLMVGSGNVGLVVSYQLMQAGIQVAAVVDAAGQIGGYGVHAAKVARCGVPFHTRHTVLRAEGEDRVEAAVIAAVDEAFQPIPGSEKRLEVDTICLAVGLNPMSQLLQMAGAPTHERAGTVPETDEYGETGLPRVFAAGDVAGIEEASSAMITGRIAGLRAANRLGYLGDEEFARAVAEQRASLGQLHQGMFAPQNKGKPVSKSDEGIALSRCLLEKGYLDAEDVGRFPGVGGSVWPGIRPVVECTQNIPCNPCQDVCRFRCIQVGDNITSLPTVNPEARCSGCGLCVAACPGQAIFLVDDEFGDSWASVTMPYEFLPHPAVGTVGVALDRGGRTVCAAEVVACKNTAALDRTVLLTIKVPRERSMQARFFRPGEETV